nr:PREDICTED: uncharacterized protein LOC106703629 [Latimeria chalumnae]|eukprot:XP_014344362.1 PREDICTED: uncharacterized protein LOC106703629 [Latimeria chalumnae]
MPEKKNCKSFPTRHHQGSRTASWRDPPDAQSEDTASSTPAGNIAADIKNIFALLQKVTEVISNMHSTVQNLKISTGKMGTRLTTAEHHIADIEDREESQVAKVKQLEGKLGVVMQKLNDLRADRKETIFASWVSLRGLEKEILVHSFPKYYPTFSTYLKTSQ